MKLSRRNVVHLLTALGLAPGFKLIGVSAASAGDEWRHGTSLFGQLKYPADFKHFDYVKPDAPKGGRVRMYGIGTFDSLNPFTFKGNAAGLVGRAFESLMASSLDEPSSEYGLIAEAVRHPDDFSSVSFRLNPKARFNDGTPVTVEDVIWSLTAVKQAHPQYAFYYKNVIKGEQTGEREMRFEFSESGNRELPHIVGQLPVLSKAWWTGKDAKGEDRNIQSTTLERPVGTSAYEVSEVKTGDSITIKRVEDYWGKDLPVAVGRDNFDEITMIYFRDQSVAHEAFKGDQYDWRTESNSKVWATGYDFPAVRKGQVVTEEIGTKNGQGMQGFVFNTRRAMFQDPQVRRAFNFAFDFEWSNKNLFYGQYRRTDSYFSNTELASSGLPQGEELSILQTVKDDLPEEVFTTEFTNPVNDNPGSRRENLREAAKMLRAAGWKPGKDRILHNDKGEPFEIEFLLVQPAFERIVLPYVKQLGLLGIKSSVRTVDVPQFRRRTDSFDFDIIVSSWGQSLSPGNEQRDFWGSAAADREASRNLAGIRNKAIDALIERVIFAKDREDLVAATHALDRALLWHHYVVPMWHIPYRRTARWDRFGKPARIPEYSLGFPTLWWWDEERAAKVKAG